ncbi:MAG: 3-dehydroquinate synthase [Clostridia bacterium]|nr:3-dehydroquinate synthase [Clostridia bacterium]
MLTGGNKEYREAPQASETTIFPTCQESGEVARSLSSVKIGTTIRVGDAPPAQGYDTVIAFGALQKAGDCLDLDRKVMIVTDDGVPAGYAQTLAAQCKEAYIHTVPQGEGSKSLAAFAELLSALLEKGFTRGDCVAAVGGGVVGDLAGFTAASYLRGVDFYNVPTTLLAQVDSSVGGKTAVNFGGLKNTVGAFYFPKKVLIDPDLLATLDARLLSAGLAEAIKMAATLDAALLKKIENSVNLTADLPAIVARSVELKRDVVERDPYETGLRRVLNFGHTVGHAIESAQPGRYYHGECVAMGMLPLCGDGLRARLKAVLEKYGLPTSYDGDRAALVPLLARDKKRIGDTVRTVYAETAGTFAFMDMTPEEIGERIGRYL